MTQTATETMLRAQEPSGAPAGGAAKKYPRARRPWSDVAFGVWGVLVMLFLFLPIIVIVVYSFNTGRLLVSWDGFGLEAFATI
ncbi:MAG: ABC transporter permease, partial [Microbacterium sp.]